MSISTQQATTSNIKWSIPKQIGVVILVVVLLGSLGWFAVILREETRRITFTIPPGTGQLIEAGQTTVEFPDEIALTLGLKDTIVIENKDDRIHSFGPFVVGPNSILTKRFDVPITYQRACTFHQEQQMQLVVNPAPWHIFN